MAYAFGSRESSSRSRTPGITTPMSAASARRTSPMRSSSASESGGTSNRASSPPISIADGIDADESEREFRPAHDVAARPLPIERLGRLLALPAPLRGVRNRERAAAEHEKDRTRKRRNQREREKQSAGAAQHVRTREKLRGEIGAERAVGSDARHHHAHRGRNEERRQRRDERVADREQGERVERVERRESVIRDADDESAGEVQRHDDERRDRVAFDELAGAVHRAVEIGLALHRVAFGPSARGIERAGMHVGVDRHLFPRHRVERESRRHLGHPLRPARDDDELNRHQNCEHDQSDDEIAVHDERAEGRNDAADRSGRRTGSENQPRRRDVEREPEQRRH